MSDISLGAMPPEPTPGGAGNPVMDNLSLANPVDASLIAQDITPETTVRDVFAKMGIDVDGPVSQLTEKMPQMISNGDPMQKMKNIAGGSQPMGGRLSRNPGRPPLVEQEGEGLDGLINRLGGENG